METQELIIQLIQQDMKHQYLVESICKAGFEAQDQHLDILKIVAQLMGIAPHAITDEWIAIYMKYLDASSCRFEEITNETLREHAVTCYAMLLNIK